MSGSFLQYVPCISEDFLEGFIESAEDKNTTAKKNQNVWPTIQNPTF